MHINLVGNVDRVLGATARLHPQFRFAAAAALSRTMREAAKAMPAALAASLDRPTVFSRKGFYSTTARKADLRAETGIKSIQAQYLHYQVEGGTRAPARRALKLPTAVPLDPHGNIPRGKLTRLIAKARAQRKTGGRRGRGSAPETLFYGRPRGGGNRPAGIYRRLRGGGLVQLIAFPRTNARYQRRFDFHRLVERAVLRSFEAQLARAWTEALATSR